MKLRALVLLCVVGLIGADQAKKKDKSDQDKLQGTWSVVSVEPAPLFEQAKTFRFVFSGDKIVVKTGDKEETPATLKLDSTKKPKTIDITPIEKGRQFLGIYELDGDNLKICFTEKKDAERPKEFKGIEGDVQILFVLKRDKK